MELSDKQKEVLHKIYKFPFDRPFFLGGFAGTGKTTLLKQMELDRPNRTLFLAPTGKACHVLKSKLPPTADVRTIHSFLYTPMEVTRETIERWEKEAEEGNEFAKNSLRNYRKNHFKVEFIDDRAPFDKDMVVVDESSMVGKREFSRLEAMGVPVVFMGDPFQLPPVQSGSILPSNADDFDGFLYEVHRAALDSPITRLSMDIRSGNFSGVAKWAKEGIEYSKNVGLDTLRSVGQVITGMNASRWKLNRAMRYPAVSSSVQRGDKVILKENIHGNKGKLFLVNGAIGYVEKVIDLGSLHQLVIQGMRVPKTVLRYTDVLFQQNYGKEAIIPEEKNPKNFKFDYAYAITCHASQGSEWKSVLVYDDKMRACDRSMRLRWLYTAVTRAKERLVYIDK